jgi:hypothetical protein
MNVIILGLAMGYLNATINRKPENWNQRLEQTGLAKPGKICGLMGMGPGFACQDSAGRVFGRVWNPTVQFERSEPGLLAGYPDPLLKV